MILSSQSLAVIAARYQTRVTIFVNAGDIVPLILAANPQRIYVKFETWDITFGVWHVIPGPVPQLPTGSFLEDNQGEYKFQDCPSLVTGEWYAVCPPNGVIQITECLLT